MKTRGRKYSPGERSLLRQVAAEFTEIKKKFGARQAAKKLRVSLASFYKYAAGEDLPRMEVLRDAREHWGIEWRYLDPTEVLLARKFKSAEQILLPYIQSVEEDDVEVVQVGAGKNSCLHVMIRIRFPS
jgi:hypothetical protein